MKLYWGIFSLITSIGFSAEKVPAPAGMAANLYYFEVHPKEPLKLTLSSSVCASQQIQVKTFESSELYPSVDSGKRQNVRIINVYADAPAECPPLPKEQAAALHVVKPDSKRMTHVYVTASRGVTLK